MMADLRVASTEAFFAESFVKLGLISGDGGAWLLQQAIGPARAAEMTLTGDRVNAETALAWGLVSHVVSPRDLLSAAVALAERIAVNPPRAVRAAKILLRESRRMDLAATLEMSAAMQSIAHHSEDHRAAISPGEQVFQGR
jgi:enoyl-CoA hydratase/carnithine racemase